MFHDIFGEVEFHNHWWEGKADIDFFGTKINIDLLIEMDYAKSNSVHKTIEESQCHTYEMFLEKWPDLQEAVVGKIITYYNEEERFSYGPKDEAEFQAWWPPLDTIEAMLQNIIWEAIAIPYDALMQRCYGGKRCLYLLFRHGWGNDLDGHGVGIRLLNEEIEEIGYQEIAF